MTSSFPFCHPERTYPCPERIYFCHPERSEGSAFLPIPPHFFVFIRNAARALGSTRYSVLDTTYSQVPLHRYNDY